MNNLEKANLERWCRKRNIDTAYVDSALTYSENITNLQGKEPSDDLKGMLQWELESLRRNNAELETIAAYWKWQALLYKSKIVQSADR